MILPKKFFQRPTKQVAIELLGKFLVREKDGQRIAEMITEVEIYDGPKDLASHASRGKTLRNGVMFEFGGVWYVYFVYGMHYMVNIVTSVEDYPSAILLRGTSQTKGPAKLAKKFAVDKSFSGLVANRKNGLWVEDRGIKISKNKIKRGERIGVNFAGPIWAKKKLRYYLGI